MGVLFTRDGTPLRVSGSDVFDRSGRQVARRHGDRLHGPDGAYRATVVGDRAVYRSADNVCITPAFAPRTMAGPPVADRPRAALRGDEPFAAEVTPAVGPVTRTTLLTLGSLDPAAVLDQVLARHV